MPKPMHNLPTNVQLLTLLNVSAAKPSKKKRGEEDVARDWVAEAKRIEARKGKKAKLDLGQLAETATAADVAQDEAVDQDGSDTPGQDSFAAHFGADTALLSIDAIKCSTARAWKRRRISKEPWGPAISFDNTALPDNQPDQTYIGKIAAKRADLSPNASAFLDLLARYRDVHHASVHLDEADDLRRAASAHAMNHVVKTRSRILKNNELLSKAAATPRTAAVEAKDQGFTRPKVLILAPLRNSALAWLVHLASFAGVQTIEQLERFRQEFNLPDGTSDSLAENADEYPDDHVATFSGNIDDTFRVGLKMTRKTLKLFSEFYSSDVILASPLGLRTSIEKDDDSDFLSSIEMLVVDQADVMLMQNWEHVQFVLDRLNKIPTNTRDTDFSRVKPWYLEDRASLLRQSIVLSSFDTPEIRSLVMNGCVNVAGKIKLEGPAPLGVLDTIPKGYKQIFHRFESVDVQKDDDARFEFFTQKILPMLRKSAVSSTQTVIVVPSYFDFVRLKRHVKSLPDFDYAAISEYSPVPDVSRARGAFFNGRASFLIMTERFHFFRRYRIRGGKTFVFYGPPEHAHYYSEILNFPFRKPSSSSSSSLALAKKGTSGGDDGEPVDMDELSAIVCFSQFDRLKLERICGRAEAKKMTQGLGDRKFSFV